MTWLGLDLGESLIRAGVHDGTDLVRWGEVGTPSDYEELLERIRQWSLAATGGLLDGIGIGAPGAVTDGMVEFSLDVPFLEGKHLAADVENLLECPVRIANGAQLVLLGEAWTGAAQNHGDVILLAVGQSISGAIMRHGRIIRGIHGAAGAFGWLALAAERPGDSQGWTLDRWASGRTLESLARSLDPPRSARQAIDDARKGDPDCVSLLDDVGASIGTVLAGLVSALDPELVVVSDGLGRAFEQFEEAFRKAFENHASPYGRAVPVRSGVLGPEAGVYGAAYLAREEGAVWA